MCAREREGKQARASERAMSARCEEGSKESFTRLRMDNDDSIFWMDQ